MVRTAASMHCQSGGWLGIEAIAAKAKMWNSEPAGRWRHWAITKEHAPATTVVAITWSQVPAAPESPPAWTARANRLASRITTSMSEPARTWMKSRLRCSSPRP